jgi:hypothetical protein
MTTLVHAFFYGSYMNLEVLAQVDLRPRDVEIACLPGFDIRIAPLANLVPSHDHSVYGILARASHAELERLYAHARDVLGGTYLPRAVVVETRDRRFVPALCYIADDAGAGAPSADYLERILKPARELDFPDWYVRRLESFGARS